MLSGLARSLALPSQNGITFIFKATGNPSTRIFITVSRSELHSNTDLLFLLVESFNASLQRSPSGHKSETCMVRYIQIMGSRNALLNLSNQNLLHTYHNVGPAVEAREGV